MISITATSAINPKNIEVYRVKQPRKRPEKSGPPLCLLQEQHFTKEFISSIPKASLNQLAYLWQLYCRFGTIFPSQKTIGKKIGRCDRTVRRITKRLKEAGLVSTTQAFNTSLEYELPTILQSPRVRAMLSLFNRAFKFLPLWMLSVYGEIQGDVRLGLSNIYIYNPLKLVSHMEPSTKVTPPPRHADPEKAISSTLKSLSCLKLSRCGQIHLACYPDEALLYAQRKFYHQKGERVRQPDFIQNPYHWFKTVCDRYCRQRELPVDHEIVESLLLKFPQRQGARMLLPMSDNSSNPPTIGHDPDWESTLERLQRESPLFAPEELHVRAKEEARPILTENDEEGYRKLQTVIGWFKEAQQNEAKMNHDQRLKRSKYTTSGPT